MLIVRAKGIRESLSPHFNIVEFDCPCKVCTKTFIDTYLIDLLEKTRHALAAPIKITSGYRCKNYQAELRLRGYETSSGISQHELGRAADIMSEPLLGLDLEKAAKYAGFQATGVGSHFVHVDLRDDKKRRWTYLRG